MNGEYSGEALSRRSLARGAAGGMIGFGLWGGFARGAQENAMEGKTVFDVTALGAKGDGKSDDTAAIQKALDAAGEVSGAVFVPPGTYLVSRLKMHPNTVFSGVPAWDYRNPGGSVLQLADEKAPCLLDMAGAVGATVEGLSLEGGRLGEDVCGIGIAKDDYVKEDALRIERVKVARFSGDGIRMRKVWCFTVRQSMIAYSGGDGINAEGWDGFLIDNWLSGNRGVGFGRGEHCSITMTANRIEWNREGGILLVSGSHYNITGNYIDRSGRAGITLLPGEEYGAPRIMTITGNLIYRSGKHAEPGSHDSCHARIEGARGVVFTGNTMTAGRDDGQKGDWSPSYGLVLKDLDDCIVRDNVLYNGALEDLILDLGGHGEGAIIGDNPGRLLEPE